MSNPSSDHPSQAQDHKAPAAHHPSQAQDHKAPAAHQKNQQAWKNKLLALFGVASLANGAWMLVQPERWYHDIPAGVPDFGALNPHFIRDVACAFLTVGVALIWAARSERHRFPLAVIGALFYAGHAIVHVYDTARGYVASDHWWIDVPGVYLPAAVLVFLAVTLQPKFQR